MMNAYWRGRAWASLLSAGLSLSASAQLYWPQFRGPNGSGVAPSSDPPVTFGPHDNLLWTIDLPAGNSSPTIAGNRVFLTGFEENRLSTLSLDRREGKLLWRREIVAGKIEAFHPKLNTPTAPTPATDGERVYVYFGSVGLLAYDLDGRELWRRPLPLPITDFGTGTSPIVAGDRVVLNCDQDTHSFLLAVDTRDGHTLWERPRPEFPRGFGTPIVWHHDDRDELVVPGTVWLKAYDLVDGHERWRVRGQARVVCTTAVVGAELLIAASWSPGGDAGSRLALAPFDRFCSEHDQNKDGVLTRDEFPQGPLLERFSQIDADKDGRVTRTEWETMVEIFARAENSLLAVRPGGQGDVTQTHVAWKRTRGLPYVPSPLYLDGRVYLVKSGGLVSCYEAKTGKPVYLEERLGALGDYYAAPVAAGERIYACSQEGTVVVFRAGETLNVIARNQLAETILATPALAESVLYVRTARRLYAFGR